MNTWQIVIIGPDVRLATAQLHVAIKRAIGQVAFAVQAALVKKTPVSQDPDVTGGNLANAWDISFKFDGPNYEAVVFNPVSYLKYVIRGTGIYGPYGKRIVPVRAAALAWTFGGQLFIRKSVAGMKGRDFIKEALEEARGEVNHIFATEMVGWYVQGPRQIL